MNYLKKVFRPSPEAKSRIHDLQGCVAPPKRVAINLPRAIWSRLKWEVVKQPPRQPWISYDAAARIKRFMRRRPCTVLEFGSGGSTLWSATQAVELHSVEHNREWHARVQELLAGASYSAKVAHELCETEEAYSTFRSDTDQAYDIILIDGIWRLPVARHHVDRLAPEGMLYLDNSDANSSSDHVNEIPELLAFLEDWSSRTGRTMEVYTDFSPTALHATQGRMYFGSAASV